jgi:hypothetical protein
MIWSTRSLGKRTRMLCDHRRCDLDDLVLVAREVFGDSRKGKLLLVKQVQGVAVVGFGEGEDAEMGELEISDAEGLGVLPDALAV